MKRLACALLLLAGCDPAPASIEPLPLPVVPEVGEVSAPSAADRACSRPAIAGARPLPGAPRVGSAVALVHHDDRTLAYVADADAEAVRVVDVDAGRELASADVRGKPSALMALGDGRVMVTLSDRHALAVLAPQGAPSHGLELVCTRSLPTEPVGLASSADEKTLAVTSRWGKRLTVLDADMNVRREIPLARDPHGVVLASQGRRATVAHAFGALVSVVDLDTGEVSSRGLVHEERPPLRNAPRDDEPPIIHRRGTQAYALVPLPDDEMALPLVLADPGDVRVFVSTAYYGGTAEVPVMASGIARLGRGASPTFASPPALFRTGYECLLPRAGAYDAADKLLWVACLGIDRVFGYDEAGMVRRSVEVASGPLGVAVDAPSRRLVAWSQFAGALTVAALDGEGAPRRIALVPRSKLDPKVARGRALFHEAGGTRIAFDGRACASCHPEGRDDSITWLTPEGPRQTPMLVGRLEGTAPYGWDGRRGDLHTYLKQTLRRLGGKGLTAGERDALIAYLHSLEPPRVSPAPSELARRGAEIFASATTGCAGCHAGGTTTDRRLHDVGSAARLDRIADIDTPSLRFLSQSAPYFHDGRYASLDAMLEDPHLKMGWTRDLPPADRQALVAYLETL